MIKSYLTLAFRNISRNKFVSFINIFGLAAGISSCILIFIFVRNEENYDRKNPNADRIYRIEADITLSGQKDHAALSSFMLAPALMQDFPEVELGIRVMPIGRQTVWLPGRAIQLDYVCFTDSTFFKMFNYEFICGNPNTALSEPYTIVLTEESANLLFGSTGNAVGKMVKFARASYKVTAIIKAPKNQSHLYFSSLLSISSLPKSYFQLTQDWFRLSQATYVMFRTAEQGKNFAPKLRIFEAKHIAPFLKQNQLEGKLNYTMHSMPAIHLDAEGEHFEYADVGKRSYIYIFSVVAFFILIIACINYINLATAKSAKRAKEVGIRKTSGATRIQIVQQFLGESIFITVISVLLALCFTEILLPFFNQLTDKSLSLSFADPGLVAFIFLIILFVGSASGVYPAFYLSKFLPVQVLKTNNVPKSGNVFFRKFLVVAQFFISIGLIIGTLVVYRQMQYIKNKDIGFSKDHVYVLKTPVADSSFANKYQELKNEFVSNPSIIKVGATDAVPGNGLGAILQFVDNNNKREERLMNMMPVDYDFLSLMNIGLVQGRNFSKEFASDDTAAFIVNETAVKQFGWKDPLNIKMINALGFNGKVIGVVKDFNYVSLQKPVEPLVMMLNKKLPAFLLVKVKPENLPATINFIETKWKMFSKKYPLEAFFLDDNFDKQYRAEDRMLTVFTYFSALTIIIACLGLLALASFTAEQRTKEIGIRKVLGASSANIVMLLTRDFIKLVIIAFAIAVPIAWFAMNQWLQNFAYRITISVWINLAAGMVALCVALLTISYQAIRAANQNPAESIKYE